MTDLLPSTSRLHNGRLIPPAGVFQIDPVHTFATFRAQHLVVGRVRGRFEGLTGTVTVGEDPLDSHVEVSIDAASITTGMPMRDDDLRSPTFLDTEHHPHLSFRSTALVELTAGQWSLAGQLTIRGVSQSTDLLMEFGGAVPDPFGNLRLAFHAATTITRRDFGLVHDLESQTGHLLVGRDVTIDIDAEATRPL